MIISKIIFCSSNNHSEGNQQIEDSKQLFNLVFKDFSKEELTDFRDNFLKKQLEQTKIPEITQQEILKHFSDNCPLPETEKKSEISKQDEEGTEILGESFFNNFYSPEIPKSPQNSKEDEEKTETLGGNLLNKFGSPEILESPQNSKEDEEKTETLGNNLLNKFGSPEIPKNPQNSKEDEERTEILEDNLLNKFGSPEIPKNPQNSKEFMTENLPKEVNFFQDSFNCLTTISKILTQNEEIGQFPEKKNRKENCNISEDLDEQLEYLDKITTMYKQDQEKIKDLDLRQSNNSKTILKKPRKYKNPNQSKDKIKEQRGNKYIQPTGIKKTQSTN